MIRLVFSYLCKNENSIKHRMMENPPSLPFSLSLFAFALISFILRLPAEDEKKTVFFHIFCFVL